MLARTVAAVALALLVAACNDEDAEPQAAPTPPADAVELPEGVAATVDGVEIPVERVEERLAMAEQSEALQAHLELEPEAMEEMLAARLLSGLIMREVVVDGATEMGIDPTEEDIAEARAQLEEAVGGPEELAEQMAVTGVGEEAVAEELEALTLLHLVGEQLTDEATEGEELTDDERQREIQRRTSIWLAQRLADAEVEVDAAYGRWEPTAGQVLPWRLDPDAPEL